MLLGQLEALVEIARQGNLSRAAAVLHVTQPALTARLHGLEDGGRGCRCSRGVGGAWHLTDAGRAFLPYAERALAAVDDGAGLLADLGGAASASWSSAPHRRSARTSCRGVLVRFVGPLPRVRLVVRTGHSEEILDMAVRGDIQVGLVRELAHPEIESRAAGTTTSSSWSSMPRSSASPAVVRSIWTHHRCPADPVRPDVELLRPDQRLFREAGVGAQRRHGA